MKTVRQRIRERIADASFQKRAVDLLTEICAVDTTPHPDVDRMRRREAEVYDRLEAFLDGRVWRCERRPISPAMASHPAFSKLHFTRTAERPEGLPPAQAYAGRCNLVVGRDGRRATAGCDTAVNAHIDVVAPFFPPTRKDNCIRGRGVVDDKGNVVALCAALQVIAELIDDGSLALRNRLTAMFPVEEETGGNGSLALALDRELKERYQSLLVLECAGMGVYPGNRGAVWFLCRVERKAPGGYSLLEATAYGVLEMQNEGAAIKDESAHPLFPHRPVQTCNGILGPFGEHPSRINGRIDCLLKVPEDAEARSVVEQTVAAGVARYVDRYGDKTAAVHPDTGCPRVERHTELAEQAPGCFRLRVHGSTGHMGSILENDDAIVKWAFIVRELVERRRSGRLPCDLLLPEVDPEAPLVLEGGQGFLPTHTIESVQDRMAGAFARGVSQYLELLSMPSGAIKCSTSYEKLHNSAFAGDPESPTMCHAVQAAEWVGVRHPGEPIRGWDVSCDARLFAGEYPDMPVVTSGLGHLGAAHSDDESLSLPELWHAVEFCALYLLIETGSLNAGALES